jgi:ribonuclease Z
MRPLGRSLLFDCGQLNHLATRILKSISTVFISHPHMDHFMGLATLIRHNHVSPKTIDVYGPPGIAIRVSNLLGAFAWNLAEPYWCTIRVHEVHPGLLSTTLFPGPEGFVPKPASETAVNNQEIFHNELVTVRAAILDHKLPVLAFRLDETPAFVVDPDRLDAAGLLPGPWIREMKTMMRDGRRETLAVLAREKDGTVVHKEADSWDVYGKIQGELKPASIGYLTDVGATAANLAAARELLDRVTLLVADCSFLAADEEKALASYHFTTKDLAAFSRDILPTFLLPTHFSKAYQERSNEVYTELALPAETALIRIPEHIAPRPLLNEELIQLGRRRGLMDVP